MERKLAVQWFPGHMTKAKRMIEAELKIIDVVVEMLDARAPYASSNPLLLETLGNKTKIIILNKIDLADPKTTSDWIKFFAEKGFLVVQLDANQGKGIKNLIDALKKAALPMTQKWLAKGVKNKSIRTMIAGIPNVGKSSLINRLLKSAKVKTADTPGVTRGKQWLSIGNGLEILDTPGILWPKFEDQWVCFALAVTGAIKDEIFDMQQAALMLLDFLKENYLENIQQRYNITLTQLDSAEDMLMAIAKNRGCLLTGGLYDTKKVSQILLKDFRAGLLGKISLDKP